MWGTLVPILGAISDPIINHVHLDPEWQYAGIAPIFVGLFLIRKCSQLYPSRTIPLLDCQVPMLRLLCGEEILRQTLAEVPLKNDGYTDNNDSDNDTVKRRLLFVSS